MAAADRPPGGNNPAGYFIPAEQQRGALTLSDGRIIVGFGGLFGDCGQYHGYLVSLPESGAGALESYRVPSAREGAIWATGGALVSAAGDLYVATGNGSSVSSAEFDEGNSVIELSPSLARIGVWAPADWALLSRHDWDLGSSGPIQVPGSGLLFVAGTPMGTGSVGYLLDATRLGGVGRGSYRGPVCPQGGDFGSDASDVLGSGPAARILIFVPCSGGTEALLVDPGAKRFRPLWSAPGPNGSPIVAGGVVWALDWSTARLYGLEPASGRTLLERPTGPLEHFAVPAAGDGFLFIPTANGVEAFRTRCSGRRATAATRRSWPRLELSLPSGGLVTRRLFALIALLVTLCAAAAQANAASTPSRATLVKRYRGIQTTVNNAGATFVYLAGAMIRDRASGAKIYSLAAHPFMRALEFADRSLLAMGASGNAEKTLLSLVTIDRRVIGDLQRVAKDGQTQISAWQNVIASDANATVAVAVRLRAELAAG